MISWLWIVACRLAPRIDVSQRHSTGHPHCCMEARDLQAGEHDFKPFSPTVADCPGRTDPHLPEGLDRLSIRNLQVGQATADLIVQRYSGTVGLNVERPTGNVEVLLLN